MAKRGRPKKKTRVVEKPKPVPKITVKDKVQIRLVDIRRLDERKAQGWIVAEKQPDKYKGTDLKLCIRKA